MKQKIIAFLRFICLIYLVFFIPKVISIWSSGSSVLSEKLSVLFGVENIVSSNLEYKHLKQLRFVLLHDEKSFDQAGNKSEDLLVKNGFCIKNSFLKDQSDDCKKFIEQNSIQVDAILIDVQDSGIKSFKTKKILQDLLTFALHKEKKVIVLDRPNVLGGIIEGPGKIPWRHGLTIGELAIYINRYVIKSPAGLIVIPLKGWRRGRTVSSKTVSARDVFKSFDPLKKIRPFYVIQDRRKCNQLVLLKDEEKLSLWETRYLKRLCWHLGLRCFDCEYRRGENRLVGVRLSLKNDISNFSAFNSLLTITRFLKNRKQVELSFDKTFDEEFDSLDVRDFLQEKLSFVDLKEKTEKSLLLFYDKSRYCCLYKPLPHVVSPKIVKV